MINKAELKHFLDFEFSTIRRELRTQKVSLTEIQNRILKIVDSADVNHTRAENARTIACGPYSGTTEITNRFMRDYAKATEAVCEYEIARDAIRRGKIESLREQEGGVVKYLSLSMATAEILMETLGIREPTDKMLDRRLQKSANKIRAKKEEEDGKAPII